MKIKDHFLTGEIFELKDDKIEGIKKTFPIPENLDRYYNSEDYISHHQDSNNLRTKIYKIFQHFNLNYKYNIVAKNTYKDAAILDYGCGAGDFLKVLENDFVTFGYEPNDSALQAAALKNNKTAFVDDISKIENNTLQAITLWHVLEHIENLQDTIKIFHNKLTDNGLLIIAVPNHLSYDAKKYKENWAAYDVPRHIWHFSQIGISNLLKENWILQETKPLILDAYYISLISEKYKKNPLFWLSGLFYGTISNLKSLKSGEFSSLIYIFRKK